MFDIVIYSVKPCVIATVSKYIPTNPTDLHKRCKSWRQGPSMPDFDSEQVVISVCLLSAMNIYHHHRHYN